MEKRLLNGGCGGLVWRAKKAESRCCAIPPERESFFSNERATSANRIPQKRHATLGSFDRNPFRLCVSTLCNGHVQHTVIELGTNRIGISRFG